MNWDSFKYRNYDYAIYRFMTADPLAHKYPGISPFTYTADNPVMLVDPDGRDWYENQKTGEVIHNPHEGKGWEKTLGKDWAHLAKEGEIIDPNKMNPGQPIDIWYAYYNPSEAKTLMENNGREFKPIQQTVIVVHKIFPCNIPQVGHLVLTYKITEKSSYIKISSVESGRANITEINFSMNIIGETTQISRQKIYYSNSLYAQIFYYMDKMFPKFKAIEFESWEEFFKRNPFPESKRIKKFIEDNGTD